MNVIRAFFKQINDIGLMCRPKATIHISENNIFVYETTL